jgi:cytochrome b561
MKYPASIRAIHWLNALLIIGLLALGIFMTPFQMDNMAFSEELYFWHKSFGLLALLMVVFRLINRRLHTLPDLPQGMPKHEQLAAKIVHKTLYALLIIVPILGYIQSSTYEYSSGVHFFGIVLPELFADNKSVFEAFNFVHRWTSYLLIVLIVGHVAGALKHRFFDKENDVLERII